MSSLIGAHPRAHSGSRARAPSRAAASRTAVELAPGVDAAGGRRPGSGPRRGIVFSSRFRNSSSVSDSASARCRSAHRAFSSSDPDDREEVAARAAAHGLDEGEHRVRRDRGVRRRLTPARRTLERGLCRERLGRRVHPVAGADFGPVANARTVMRSPSATGAAGAGVVLVVGSGRARLASRAAIMGRSSVEIPSVAHGRRRRQKRAGRSDRAPAGARRGAAGALFGGGP